MFVSHVETGIPESSLKTPSKPESVTTSSNVGEKDASTATETAEAKVDYNFICAGCGNRCNNCHQYVYGSWLVQEVISLLNEKEADKLSDDDVRHTMKYVYNKQLNFHCYRKTYKYDQDCWYDFPDCLETGSVEYALKVICNQQIFFHLQKRREGGIVGQTMCNTATAIYDYSYIL